MADRKTRSDGRRVAEALGAMADGGGEVIAVARSRTSEGRAVRLVVLPGHVRAETRGGDETRLAAMGWRRPVSAGGPWSQVVYPQRPRDDRTVGEWATATLRKAHGASGPIDVLTKRREGERAAVFAGPAVAQSAADVELLDGAERVISNAPFRIHRHATHLEASAARRHLRAHLGVSVVRATLSVNVLHLVDPDEATVAAHLDANAALDGAPFTYALRALAGGGRALCLQAKSSAPLPFLAIVLCSMIEPLLAAQRSMRSAPRR
jgi:hypothetical protein